MKELKNTKTEKNLMKAFAGESQARNRYTYYSSVAKKEGYLKISKLFDEIANQEKEHAKVFYKYLNNYCDDEIIEITSSFPVFLSTNTKYNLTAAAKGEYEEYSILYPLFSRIALEEGFFDIAESFKQISIAENYHEERFLNMLSDINNNKVFNKDFDIIWKCTNCGFIYESKEAPKVCPACNHDQMYFEELNTIL